MPLDILDRLIPQHNANGQGPLPVAEAPSAATADQPIPAAGARLEAIRETMDLLEADAGVGSAGLRVANCSTEGLHFAVVRLDPAARTALDAKLAAVRAEEFIARAVEVAAKISTAFETVISPERSPSPPPATRDPI